MKRLFLESEQIQSTSGIIQAVETVLKAKDPVPLLLVPAMGSTRKQLLEASEKATAQAMVLASTLAEGLRTYHMQIAQQLTSQERWTETRRDLGFLFQEVSDLLKGLYLLGEFSPRASFIVSFYGDTFATTILAQTLEEHGRKARALIDRALLIDQPTPSLEEEIETLLAEHVIPVVPCTLAAELSS